MVHSAIESADEKGHTSPGEDLLQKAPERFWHIIDRANGGPVCIFPKRSGLTGAFRGKLTWCGKALQFVCLRRQEYPVRALRRLAVIERVIILSLLLFLAPGERIHYNRESEGELSDNDCRSPEECCPSHRA